MHQHEITPLIARDNRPATEKNVFNAQLDPVKDEMKSAFTSVSKSQVFLLASSKEIFPCKISRRKNID